MKGWRQATGTALIRVVLILLALAFMGRSAEGARYGAATGAGVIRFAVPSGSINVGAEVTVDIWLEDVSDVYGIDIAFSFDPDVVTVPAGQVLPLWEVFDSSNHFTIRNEVDNVEGLGRYAIANLNPAEPFTGSGRVCSITFRAVGAGTGALQFTSVKASDRDGGAIYPTRVGATLTVGGWRTYLPIVLGR